MSSRAHKRRDSLLALLRARESATVPELAEELGVSERTLFRDLARLRGDGFDVEAEPGRGGGIRLSARTPLAPLRLTLDEGLGLWLSLGLMRRSAGLPFARGAKRAMDRVFAALPPDRRRSMRRLCERVIVGPSATANVQRNAREPSSAVLAAVEQAFFEQHCLAFHYVDRHGACTGRRIEPHGLLVQWPVWYVLAWDLHKAAPRSFRMDRISRPRALSESSVSARGAEVVAALADFARA